MDVTRRIERILHRQCMGFVARLEMADVAEAASGVKRGFIGKPVLGGTIECDAAAANAAASLVDIHSRGRADDSWRCRGARPWAGLARGR